MGVQQGAERTRVKKALGCRAGELGLDQRVIFLLPQPVRQRHREAALRRVGQPGRQAAGRGGAQGDFSVPPGAAIVLTAAAFLLAAILLSPKKRGKTV